jgi:hypothetical protein
MPKEAKAINKGLLFFHAIATQEALCAPPKLQ